MKLFKTKHLMAITTVVLFALYVISCTKPDQDLTPAPTPTPTPTSNGKDLVAFKTTVAPTMDGAADGIWDSYLKLVIKPTIPDPGNNLFTGYIGEQYPTTIRAMYDAANIYFLIEYADNTKSTNVSPWYFNPLTKV